VPPVTRPEIIAVDAPRFLRRSRVTLEGGQESIVFAGARRTWIAVILAGRLPRNVAYRPGYPDRRFPPVAFGEKTSSCPTEPRLCVALGVAVEKDGFLVGSMADRMVKRSSM